MSGQEGPRRSGPHESGSRGSRSREAGHWRVEVCDEQEVADVDADRLAAAVRRVLAGEGIRRAEVSVAVVDNAQIHQLNRQYLNHDYPTDVLSFVLSEPGEPLEGEVIVSAEMAQQRAAEFGWGWADELLLYAVHGTLHLCGHDDHNDADRQVMRQRESLYLTGWTADRLADRPREGGGS